MEWAFPFKCLLFSPNLHFTTDTLCIIWKEANSDILADGDLVLTLILLDTISKVSESFIKELVGKFGTNQIFQKEKLRNE